MVLTHLWHAWPGRHWPLLASEEEAFVADLVDASEGGPRPFDRDELSLVLTAMRSGVNVAEVVRMAPGVHPGSLLGAYVRLDEALKRSLVAYHAIVTSPDLDTLTRNAAAAAVLFPLPVYRLSLATRHQEASLEEAVRLMVEDATRVGDLESTIIADLVELSAPSTVGVSLGRKLFNPYTPALWGHPNYVPARVGALTPLRVRDLLGESRR